MLTAWLLSGWLLGPVLVDLHGVCFRSCSHNANPLFLEAAPSVAPFFIKIFAVKVVQKQGLALFQPFINQKPL